MAYTIKEIARLADVSTRTLRYYDEIGLLPPAFTGKNGYRYYDRSSLLDLQQILFFRELEVPLKEILDIIQNPAYDPIDVLESHRDALQKDLARTGTLITTLEKTISMIKGEQEMAEKDLFNGFNEKKYAQETKDRWGGTDKYKQSQKRWSSYSEEEKEAIKKKGEAITACMVGSDPDTQPDDKDVQKAIGDYLVYLNKNFYPCDAEFLRGLSEMWVADSRFAVNYERVREGGAIFVREAVEIFCNNQK